MTSEDPADGPSDSSDPSDGKPIEEIPLSLDALLDVLANERRRYLLEYLLERPDGIGSFEAATKHTITELGRKRGYQPNHDDVQVDLYQHHLPKLADAGVVEYDVRSQTIRYRENERLEAVYDRIREFEVE